MPHPLRVALAVTVIVGSVLVLALHGWHWTAGRTTAAQVLGHLGFTVVLLGGALFSLGS